ncbi:MAG: tRNA (adenosine(37)-N6)-threonylcarbamoyltransferase complex dimerization subunit type 1 TsaB, partial [Rhodospirillales bacterium]
FAALDGIAVTRGPGAFTGLRIGLAAARALGLAADSPVAAFTTLEVLAAAAGPGEQPLLVTIDSKRGDLFCQVFGPDGDARTEPRAIAPEDLAANLQGQGRSFRLAGDAMAVAAEALRSGGLCAICPEGGWLTLPDAAVLARLAAEHWPDALQDSHQGGDRFRPVPLYLRPPDAAVAADGGRLRPAAESLDGTPR